MNVEQKDKHKEKVTIPLEGMSCATCAVTIEKALGDGHKLGDGRLELAAAPRF
jgi:cation transport ATPase